MNHNILITGGAGFIGSHVIRFFVNKYPFYKIYNLDNLTYASNINNLSDIENKKNYKFLKGDICDFKFIKNTLVKYNINKVIHLAAESHVDKSINDPILFAKTNVIGTLNLLQATSLIWKNDLSDKLFFHISTDEVYGSLNKDGLFSEANKYDPKSPYAASKASADHFVRAFSNTYKIPIIISNCSNNYGPFQFPEKLIPLSINKIMNNEPIPVYGNGLNIRDWIHVDDHVNAIDVIFHFGKKNQNYNIGGSNEWKNIDLVKLIIKITDKELKRKKGTSEKLINYVNDRSGHDFRYAIDSTKLKNELNWKPLIQFEQGLKKTVLWYLQNTNYFNSF